MEIFEISDLAKALFSAGPEESLSRLGMKPLDIRMQVFWAFERGVESQLSEPLWKKAKGDLDRTYGTGPIPSWEQGMARVKLAEGFFWGVVDGAGDAIGDFVEDVKKVLKSLNITIEQEKALKELAHMAFLDPVIWNLNMARYFTAPGTAERAKVLDIMSDYTLKIYPFLSDSLFQLRMVEPALNALVEELRQPGTAAHIAVTISGEMGRLIGDELMRIMSLSNDPEKQGQEVGKIVGQLMIEIALGVLGWIDVIASLLSLPEELKSFLEEEEALFSQEEGSP